MRKYTLLLAGISLLFLTMCEPGINGPQRFNQPELEPGPVSAEMNVGMEYVDAIDEWENGDQSVAKATYTRAPLSGDLKGVFEGTIHAVLSAESTEGNHRGEGFLRLDNGIVFEVEMSGEIIGSQYIGLLYGNSKDQKYEIRLRYTESQSQLGMMFRPIVLDGSITRVPFYRYPQTTNKQ